ncbi:RNA-directed DNA polymerase, eukaryota, reverse transcriptase zinc-binding domain protein [Tanacetum coccineum]
MTTKNRSSKRRVKLPVKFKDHVMANSNKKDGLSKSELIDSDMGPLRAENRDFVENNSGSDESDGVFGCQGCDGIGEIEVNVNEVSIDESKEDEIISGGIGIETDIEDSMDKTNSPVIEKSYVAAVQKNNLKLDTSLCYKPTVIEEDGGEFVVFDEELVSKGSNKWKLTVYGKFVGCFMPENALRYHLRRMWSKYGFVDVQVDSYGGCYCKFRNEEDMGKVIELGPWIVNHKPFFVQKWDPNIGLSKKEETKIPLWAKMKNIPLEAWTKDGISALASSLGKPIRMDYVTAQACTAGRGRADFARVLVEFEAKKGFKEHIDILYRSKDNVVIGTKKVEVEYQWKPDICSHCMVFGHKERTCKKIVRNEVEENSTNEEGRYGKKENKEKDKVDNSFTEVRNRKRENVRFNNNNERNQRRWGPKQNSNTTYVRKEDGKQGQFDNQSKNMGDENNDHEKRSSTWTIQEEILSAIKKTKNKYAILEEEEYDEEIELRLLKDRMIVDNYINKSIQPTCSETQNWSKDMISYFKQKWEEKEAMKEVFEDVMEGENVSAKMCSANEISGLETAVLH